MRFYVALAALLLLVSPAHAGVYAYNAGDINNQIRVIATNEVVNGLTVKRLDQLVTIPPRFYEQFHTVRLCHETSNSAQPWIAEGVTFQTAPHPAAVPANCKIILAWGTELRSAPPFGTELARMICRDGHCLRHGSQEFDDCSKPGLPSTAGCASNEVWLYRAAHGCWPVGLTAFARMRLRPWRTDVEGVGQVSIMSGNEIVEGTKFDGNMAFRTEVSGHTFANQTEIDDYRDLPISPGPREGLWAYFTNAGHRFMALCRGFVLRPQ